MTTNAATAAALASRGWKVFPCNPENKAPYTDHGYLDASSDPAQIRAWWQQHPRALIGIACRQSGIFVLDIDRKNGKDGWRTLQAMAKEYTGSQYDPEPARQKTPSGGMHLIFTDPKGLRVPNNSDQLGEGLDLRSAGYICTGTGYAWPKGIDLATVEIGPAPAWLLNQIASLAKPKNPHPEASPIDVDPSEAGPAWLAWAFEQKPRPGNRNETWFRAAQQLRDARVHPTEAESLAIQYAHATGLPEGETISTTRSAYNGTPREPAALPGSRHQATGQQTNGNGHRPESRQPEPPEENPELPPEEGKPEQTKPAAPTHADLATEIVSSWSSSKTPVLYGLGSWRRYEGGVWPVEEEDLIKAEVKRAVTHAQAYGIRPTASIVNSVMELARLDVITPSRTWDADPDLLPCKNGILHIPTMELHPHSPDNRFTFRTAYDYDPAATAPAWIRSLETTHAEDVREFLQEWAGYCLTTDTKYEIAVWLYGTKGSGKSTYIEGLRAMLGERAGVLGLWEVENSRFGLAGIMGKTLLSATEQPAVYMQRAELLDDLISGEEIRVDQKFKDAIDIRPVAKILWAMNTLPRVSEAASGLFRRVKVVRFPDRPESQRDPAVKEAIKSEGTGILNWALAGLTRLRSRGKFSIPASVARDSKQFEDSNNVPAIFVSECCLVGPDYRAQANPLYQQYKTWCMENGHKPLSSTSLAEEWQKLGCHRTRINGRSYWLGIGLQEQDNG